jgi:hypothetical protein
MGQAHNLLPQKGADIVMPIGVVLVGISNGAPPLQPNARGPLWRRAGARVQRDLVKLLEVTVTSLRGKTEDFPPLTTREN